MSVKVFHDCRVATMCENAGPYGLVEDAAIVVRGDTISWVGAIAALPSDFASCEKLGLSGRLVTPALIDCHTHLVFAGDRSKEFEMRLQGASYAQIAQAGGGIVSTMSATRNNSEKELLKQSLIRLDALIAEGVGTVEIKSGYGLTIDDEIKMLRVARQLASLRPVHVVTTWLAAHAVPPEYSGRPDDYIADVAMAGLQRACAEGLVDAVDGFCEGIGFSTDQLEPLFELATSLGLPVKLHGEQLSRQGGAVMAAGFGALSVDHLEYLDDEGVEAMAAAKSVAVLLPGAFYTLQETQAPPVQALRDASVPIAVATDANPGTSPMGSILLAMNMAATLFGLTPEEALAGATRNAARALGLSDRGTISPDRRADLAIWSVDHPRALAYHIGANHLHRTVIGGAS